MAMILAVLVAALLQVVPERPGAAEPALQAGADEGAARPHIAEGLAEYRRLRLKAARAEFEKAVEAEPSSAAAHYYLGYTLYKIGEPTRRLTPEKELAKQHFARCFELDPTFRPTWRP